MTTITLGIHAPIAAMEAKPLGTHFGYVLNAEAGTHATGKISITWFLDSTDLKQVRKQLQKAAKKLKALEASND
jgi:hypothetical protein